MEPDSYYHIFNHANGDENLFREDRNYYFFLKKWSKYIEPIANTYAYCLMPNHIHFLIKTKSSKVFENLGALEKPADKIISQTFSNLFNSYTNHLTNSTHAEVASLSPISNGRRFLIQTI